jgi:hypothetical protein
VGHGVDSQGACAGYEARGPASGGAGLQDEDLLRHGEPPPVPGGLPALFAPCWLLVPLAVDGARICWRYPVVVSFIIVYLLLNWVLYMNGTNNPASLSVGIKKGRPSAVHLAPLAKGSGHFVSYTYAIFLCISVRGCF